MNINAPAEPEAQLACDAVANYLTEQGYHLAQELTGDDYRVTLVGRKKDKCVVADIQFGDECVMHAKSAKAIVKKLKTVMDKHDASDGIVVLPIATRLDNEAQQIFEEAEHKLLKVDSESSTVATF